MESRLSRRYFSPLYTGTMMETNGRARAPGAVSHNLVPKLIYFPQVQVDSRRLWREEQYGHGKCQRDLGHRAGSPRIPLHPGMLETPRARSRNVAFAEDVLRRESTAATSAKASKPREERAFRHLPRRF